MDDKLIFEKSSNSRIAYDLPEYEHKYTLSDKYQRKEELFLKNTCIRYNCHKVDYPKSHIL